MLGYLFTGGQSLFLFSFDEIVFVNGVQFEVRLVHVNREELGAHWHWHGDSAHCTYKLDDIDLAINLGFNDD